MPGILDMETLRRRYTEALQADAARNTLIEDLLQRVADMQKTMDRNAFVLVLLDVDCMNFLDDLITQGITGGEQAAKSLIRAIFDYIRYDNAFKHDQKIVIKLYANFRRLSKTYIDQGILSNTSAFSDFVLGFNKAHPLCDFTDAGNHKEATSTKLKETLNLYIYNVHCKQIIFGASADKGYASFLSSFFVDVDIMRRIKLLKGPPFSSEFESILPRFEWTGFNNIFKGELIPSEPVRRYPVRKVPDAAPTRPQEQPINKSVGYSSTPEWRARNASMHTTDLAVREARVLAKKTSIEIESPLSITFEVDHTSDTYGFKTTNESTRGHTSLGSSVSSGRSTQNMCDERSAPEAIDIQNALLKCARQRLQLSPKALDFSTVKRSVEQLLGLAPDFWGKSDHDEWFSKSKDIIKMAVEDWVERTDNPPPKNATWMLRYFTAGQSPSSIMKDPASEIWRTRVDMPASENENEVYEHEIPDRIALNLEGQRIDRPPVLDVDLHVLNNLRERQPRLCNLHYLVHDCTKLLCPFDHNASLTKQEFEGLVYLSRIQRCQAGSFCDNVKCIRGHMCPNGRTCKHGAGCRFANLHGIDTKIVTVRPIPG